MLFTEIINPNDIVISKYMNKENVSRCGAFPFEAKIKIELCIRRSLGVTGVNMYVLNDADQKDCRLNVPLCAFDMANDVYKINFRPGDYIGAQDGLLFYTFEICAGNKKYYLCSVNNVDFSVSDELSSVNRFRLLVYNNLSVPKEPSSSVMYHIFVDRFRKSDRVEHRRPDSEYEPDWDNGIPEYPQIRGDAFLNNTHFGGDLYGVAEKLDYLTSLGVNYIYLSPIFRAFSNHKYDTGNYMEIDELFGGEQAFKNLISQANKRNIRIILDGVFNHTGDDSLYFNKYKKYESVGAYNSEKSQYRTWYHFTEDGDYESWWGIKILPKLDCCNEDVKEYLLGENGVVRKYIRCGISGWRLDVADELPEQFLKQLRVSAKSENDNCFIIGEVWENAADKISYGKRREYFRGKELDSVMNYPLKNAIIDYVLKCDSTCLYNTLTELYSSYPRDIFNVLMNILSTHDTERILNVLSGYSADRMTNTEVSRFRIPGEAKELAIQRLKIASVLQFTLNGIPSVFYGDEAGVQGFYDPFCRMPYPWGREEKTLLSHYRFIGNLKRSKSALSDGDLNIILCEGGVFGFERENHESAITVFTNVNDFPVTVYIKGKHTNLSDNTSLTGSAILDANSFILLEKKK